MLFQLISKRVVLVMQYCEGGSLYHMLDQPSYVYGLPTEQFLLVLKHVGRWLLLNIIYTVTRPEVGIEGFKQ